MERRRRKRRRRRRRRRREMKSKVKEGQNNWSPNAARDNLMLSMNSIRVENRGNNSEKKITLSFFFFVWVAKLFE